MTLIFNKKFCDCCETKCSSPIAEKYGKCCDFDEVVKNLKPRPASVDIIFNGKKLLNTAGTFTIQAGANSETRTITTADLSGIANNLSLTSTNISSTAEAQSFVTKVDKALSSINDARSALGAMQNRLEYTANNLTTSTENLTAAESRIRDVDVAKEMVKLSKLNILNQASQAMVSQAKQQPESVSQLLR